MGCATASHGCQSTASHVKCPGCGAGAGVPEREPACNLPSNCKSSAPPILPPCFQEADKLPCHLFGGGEGRGWKRLGGLEVTLKKGPGSFPRPSIFPTGFWDGEVFMHPGLRAFSSLGSRAYTRHLVISRSREYVTRTAQDGA